MVFCYENVPLSLPEALSPRFTTNRCFFPSTDRDRQCQRSHYFSYKYTKPVSVSSLMLQLLTVTSVSAAASYSPHKLFVRALTFKLEVFQVLFASCNPHHTQACTRCFKYHKQMIAQGFSKPLKELFSFTG